MSNLIQVYFFSNYILYTHNMLLVLFTFELANSIAKFFLVILYIIESSLLLL